ncbi:MAG: hypothetical protein FJY56_18535 [Betaproteobacteria bacterium]|nr:hypothetical protein [Betaproteobacteria bacterium]
MKSFIALSTLMLLAGTAGSVMAQSTEPVVKPLATAEDPTQKTILVGRAPAGGMVITFELEPAKTMWMPMGKRWMSHAPGKDEVFHVEVKPVDPRSKTRIAYADVAFEAVNRDNKRTVKLSLHPMWGGSGLHYAANSALVGDGVYRATITVNPPTFSRDIKDKELWMQPARADFHFKLAGGKLVEVSEPAPDAQK